MRHVVFRSATGMNLSATGGFAFVWWKTPASLGCGNTTMNGFFVFPFLGILRRYLCVSDSRVMEDNMQQDPLPDAEQGYCRT